MMTQKKKLIEKWVVIPIGLRTLSGLKPFFHIGSRNLFVDFPNHYYMRFIDQLYEIALKYNNLIRNDSSSADIYKWIIKAGEEARQKVLLFNSILLESGIDWFKIYIRRNRFGKPWFHYNSDYVLREKNFIILYRIDKLRFDKHITELEKGNLGKMSLYQVYKYIFDSNTDYLYYYYTVKVPNKEFFNTIINRVKKHVENCIIQTNTTLRDLESNLETVSNKLSKWYRNSFLVRIIFVFIQELINELRTCRNLLENPPVIYREFRKVLEILVSRSTLTYLILNDYKSLLENWKILDQVDEINLKNLFERYSYIFYKFLVSLDSKEYYDQYKNHAHIRNIGDIYSKDSKHLINMLKSQLGVEKQEIIKSPQNVYSVTSLLVLRGFPISSPEEDILSVDVDKTMLAVVSAMLASNITSEENRIPIIKIIYNELIRMHRNRKLLFPVISISTMINLLKMNGFKTIKDFYNNYSFFVHHYSGSMQFFKYMSIMQYKVLVGETVKFSDTTRNLTKYLLDNIDKIRKSERIIRRKI